MTIKENRTRFPLNKKTLFACDVFTYVNDSYTIKFQSHDNVSFISIIDGELKGFLSNNELVLLYVSDDICPLHIS